MTSIMSVPAKTVSAREAIAAEGATPEVAMAAEGAVPKVSSVEVPAKVPKSLRPRRP